MDDCSYTDEAFSFKVYDRQGGAEIDSGRIYAKTKADARKRIKQAAIDNFEVPANARAHGFVPIHDWRIVFEVER
jgi:hypothetical protein